jgi:hypothetical protein
VELRRELAVHDGAWTRTTEDMQGTEGVMALINLALLTGNSAIFFQVS